MIIHLVHRLVGGVYRLDGFASRSIRLQGRIIHLYERSGGSRDHPHLFLHGLGTSSSTWILTVPQLRIRGPVVVPDLSGFGLSPPSPAAETPSFDEHLAMLRELLMAQSASRWTLIGHSLGGWLAMLLALEEPERVRSLVLLNPAGVWYEGVDQVGAAFDVRSPEDTRRLMKKLWFKFPWYYRPFLKSIHGELLRRKVFQLIGTIRRGAFVNDRLRTLQVPMALIWGVEDRLFSKESVSILQREVPTVHLRFIPQCGHVPQLERPSMTAQALRVALRAFS